jgi:hypothetical protein
MNGVKFMNKNKEYLLIEILNDRVQSASYSDGKKKISLYNTLDIENFIMKWEGKDFYHVDKHLYKVYNPTIINYALQKNYSRKPKRANNLGKTIVSLTLSGSMILCGGFSVKLIKNAIKNKNNSPIKIETVKNTPELIKNDQEISYDAKENEATIKQIEPTAEPTTDPKAYEDEIKSGKPIEQVKATPLKSEKIITTISFDYEDRSDNNRAQFVKENYFNSINKYANMYGLDANFMAAIAMQEGGDIIGNKPSSSGGYGLNQIQGLNLGSKITAYNFETKQNETITIDKNSIYDIAYNTKISCMMMQSFMKQEKYNIEKGCQAYNFGVGGVNSVVNYCKQATGSENNWLQYRHINPYGDSQYLEHIMSYIPDGTEINFQTPEGKTISMTIDNTNVKTFSR